MDFSSVFRAYDIRGVVGRDFDASWVERLGRACGARFLDEGAYRAVVAHDCRLSSPEYEQALVHGLTAMGVDVIRLGMVPVPCLYFAARNLGLHAGVMVTASHNPAAYNGFKIWLGEGALFGEAIQTIRRIMEDRPLPDAARPGLVSRLDIVPAYVEEVAARLEELGGKPAAPVRVVVDAGNGAAGPVCVRVLQRMGAEVIPLFCEPDGRFPHHHPDPVKEENMWDLRAAVLAHKADLGLGLDGDGDRLAAMDSRGRLLAGDELLAVFARDLLNRRPGSRILADVKCSQRLFDDIAARGGIAEPCATGHSMVKARLRESGGLLAGELTGHIFHAEHWYGFDDAAYGAARLLTVLARLGCRLDDLPGWPPVWNTPELTLPCPDSAKFAVARRAREWYGSRRPVLAIDGVRVSFEGGWGLVRASNTGPALVLRFEADSPERLASIRRDMEDQVRLWIQERLAEEKA